MRLDGRVAVVTGAASGIGRGMVETFLARGMRVVMADVEAAALERAAAEVSTGRRDDVIAVRTDVTVAADVEALAARAIDRFGAVHLVCNNAGVNIMGRSWELSVDDWRWVVDVNLWGVIHGIRAFVPRMISGGEDGYIVNTSSMLGVATAPNLAPYLASKHGVAALSEGLLQELRSVAAPIGVSVLCPSFVRTRILESERNKPGRDPGAAIHAPKAVAAMIDQGLEPITVGGQVADAVEDGRFWVFTQLDMFPAVEERFAGMRRDAATVAGSPAPPVRGVSSGG